MSLCFHSNKLLVNKLKRIFPYIYVFKKKILLLTDVDFENNDSNKYLIKGINIKNIMNNFLMFNNFVLY